MADTPHNSRKCDSNSLPHDIASTFLKDGNEAAAKMVDDCTIPWARRAAADLQHQQEQEDTKLPWNSYERWDHQRFRTPEVLEEKAHLFAATARRELIELTNKEILKILKKRETDN